MGPQTQLETVSRAGFDTSPFIYLFAGKGDRAGKAARLFGRLAPASKVTSIVAPIEVLSFFRGISQDGLAAQYTSFFRESGEVEVAPVDWPVCELAASLRGKYRLRLGDAIQVATAILFRSEIFITNDRGLARVTELPVLQFVDLAD